MTQRKLGITYRNPVDTYGNYYLKEARLKEGYTQKQLGRIIGVHTTAITAYERLRAMPSPEIAEKLAEVLHKSANELFPEKLRAYMRQIRKERKKDNEETHPHFIPLSLGLESSLEDPSPFTDLCAVLGISEEELRQRTDDILQGLTYIEREIIKLRYGLGDGYSYTLEEVGHIFKVTRERIRQIEAKAVRKLQKVSPKNT